ncbi:lytic polysaccharide monooxygenase [Shewanella waksmanii]|uniref:lytic polysaccharide monooxygenase n=1 Tax=Shewanella waksmanii TaxID=213783 RepID=UPI000490DA08|nr:lytic polysaccharide monooxygenase [Shewanella waksmanii]
MSTRNMYTLGLVSAALVSQTLLATLAYGHGFMQSPQARQQFCVEDGGYWWPDDGSAIPNLACRQAFLKSGTKQFVQNHEFSTNVVDYHNQASVEAAVPNGLLCAGGDSAKQGMDEPSSFWQRSQVTPAANGDVEVVFAAHTPHNPSYWEFYLSNQGYDAATQSLTWEQLTLISELGNVAAETVNGMKVYKMTINIPAHRSGDATLYTRWQRIDEAGEGFYNCSDININQDGLPPQWTDVGQYLANGIDANIGDEVWFRLFDGAGQELVFETLVVDTTNSANQLWAEQLAAQVVQGHSSSVQVGVFQADGTISYAADRSLNRVWSSIANVSYQMDIKSSANAPQVSFLSPASGGVYTVGDTALLSAQATDSDGQIVSVDFSVAGNIVAQLSQPPFTTEVILQQAGTVIVSASATDNSGLTSNTSVSIEVHAAQGGCTAAPWQTDTIYVAGDSVSYQGQVFSAKWWTRSEVPDAANEWGVWQLDGTCE